MSEFQNKNRLNYYDVNEELSKIRGRKKDFSPLKKSLKELLTNLKEFSKEDKNSELNSHEFLSLKNKIKRFHNKELNKIIESMEKEKEPTEFEQLSKQLSEIYETLKKLEDKNHDMNNIGNTTDAISEIINNKDFWTKLKQSISIPEPDLSPITQKIEYKIDCLHRELTKKIDNIKLSIPQKAPNDYLRKDDFEFTISDKLKDLKEIKESSENLETIPAKIGRIEEALRNLSEKIDNLPSSNASQLQRVNTYSTRRKQSVNRVS